MLSLTRDAYINDLNVHREILDQWSLVSEDSSDPHSPAPHGLLPASGSGGWQGAGSFWPPLRRLQKLLHLLAQEVELSVPCVQVNAEGKFLTGRIRHPSCHRAVFRGWGVHR